MRTLPFLMILALLPAASPADEAPSPAAEAPSPAAPDPRGWHPGRIAAGSETLLAAASPQPTWIPEAIAARIQRSTVLVYFSPRCPHCVDVEPELEHLSHRLKDDVDFLGVASGSSDPGDLETFVTELGITYPVIVDSDWSFSTATGLDATPSVLVMEPIPKGTVLPAQAAGTPVPNVQVTAAYLPYRRGSAAILAIRLKPWEPMHYLQEGEAVGPLTCAACHTEEALSWTLSSHYASYLSLMRSGDVDNADCMPCHTTRFDKGRRASPVTSFILGDHHSPFSAVSCEACHSSAGPHDHQEVNPREACATCHTDETSMFSIERALPLIDHHLANEWTPEEIQARLLALAQGTADRPLLAFSGETVGAEACKDCHKSEWKQWHKSPHARALKSLKAPDDENTACVACHAPRMDEGVGCEACHGPGAAHVAQPTEDNIVSLETHRPTCYVEGICQTCHDATQDPAWNLGIRLDAVQHR